MGIDWQAQIVEQLTQQRVGLRLVKHNKTRIDAGFLRGFDLLARGIELDVDFDFEWRPGEGSTVHADDQHRSSGGQSRAGAPATIWS